MSIIYILKDLNSCQVNTNELDIITTEKFGSTNLTQPNNKHEATGMIILNIARAFDCGWQRMGFFTKQSGYRRLVRNYRKGWD